MKFNYYYVCCLDTVEEVVVDEAFDLRERVYR